MEGNRMSEKGPCCRGGEEQEPARQQIAVARRTQRARRSNWPVVGQHELIYALPDKSRHTTGNAPSGAGDTVLPEDPEGL